MVLKSAYKPRTDLFDSCAESSLDSSRRKQSSFETRHCEKPDHDEMTNCVLFGTTDECLSRRPEAERCDSCFKDSYSHKDTLSRTDSGQLYGWQLQWDPPKQPHIIKILSTQRHNTRSTIQRTSSTTKYAKLENECAVLGCVCIYATHAAMWWTRIGTIADMQGKHSLMCMICHRTCTTTHSMTRYLLLKCLIKKIANGRLLRNFLDLPTSMSWYRLKRPSLVTVRWQTLLRRHGLQHYMKEKAKNKQWMKIQ